MAAENEKKICMLRVDMSGRIGSPCRFCGHVDFIHMGTEGCTVCRFELLLGQLDSLVSKLGAFIPNAQIPLAVIPADGEKKVFGPGNLQELQEEGAFTLPWDDPKSNPLEDIRKHVNNLRRRDPTLNLFNAEIVMNFETSPHLAEGCPTKFTAYDSIEDTEGKTFHGVTCPGKLRIEHAVEQLERLENHNPEE